MGPPGDQQHLSRYLVELLSGRKVYRKRWEPFVVQRSATGLNQAAVARVLADHLIDCGERRGDDTDLHRALKDRVARACGGSLSAETLRWFIGAFEMSDEHSQHLWDLFDPARDGRYVAGSWPPKDGGRLDPGWRTISVHELHRLGPDGLPLDHRTVQVLRATRDGLDCYPYRFDTTAVDVHVLRGGRAGPVHPAGDGLHAIDIAFSRPLRQGDTIGLEYVTTFRYPEPPAPELRRAIVRRIENFEIRVQFDSGCLPRRVWWATWPGLEMPASALEPQDLDAETSVHRFLDGVEGAIVGFAWEW